MSTSSFLTNLGALFGIGDSLPWTDPNIIREFEKDVNTKGDPTLAKESILRLAWALVHSKDTADVHRGIAMLETVLGSKDQPQQMRDVLYLLALGHYRAGDYSKSRQLVDQCLEMSPDFRQASQLKKVVEGRVQTDGVIGIALAATAAGVMATGVALLAKKR